MKRKNNLTPLIANLENLEMAYWKAKRGKQYSKEVLEYSKNLMPNLQNLTNEIVKGKVEVGNYHFFKIFDPKQRQICAATFPERILHHAIMNVCHPFFEKYQIYDSYASRKGKGTDAAIRRAKFYTNQYLWFLKLDFKKYFDSIDHLVLKQQLNRQFKDIDLLKLFYKIIDSYEVTPLKGLPIGNLTSQYFANHYLSIADHHAKENLKAPALVRYMDDIIIWHNDKNCLLELGRQYQAFCLEKLKLELKQFCLNHTTKGIPFLGYLIFPNQIRLRYSSRKRFETKFKLFQKKYDQLIWDESEFQRHLQSLIAFTLKANTLAYRRKVFGQ